MCYILKIFRYLESNVYNLIVRKVDATGKRLGGLFDQKNDVD